MFPCKAKHYTIPKYLEKRKLELLRRRIISRKYGYLFYRKTISHTLPSVARKYYVSGLKRRFFKLLYEASVGWKLRLRAQIHYNFKIQKNCFHTWKRFQSHKKSLLIKKKVALLHYEKHRRHLQLRLSFQKWKLFTKIKLFKKASFKWAWNHFKSKHFPVLLKPYLHRWIVLLKVAQKEKNRLYQAEGTYKIRLKRTYFRILRRYNLRRIEKKNSAEAAKAIYIKKLKQVCFARWTKYTKDCFRFKTNILLAHAFYAFQIKKIFFNKLLITVTRGKFLKHVQKALNLRIKKTTVKKWRAYIEIQLAKKEKSKTVNTFMRIKLQRKVIKLLKTYAEYRQEKKVQNHLKLSQIIKELQKKKRRQCIINWKTYTSSKKMKRTRMIQAFKFSRNVLLQKAVSNWKIFVEYNEHCRTIYTQAVKYRELKLQKIYFQKILHYVELCKIMKHRIAKAKTIYQINLLQEAIQVISLAGIQKKEQLLQNTVQTFSKKLFLSEKYLSIWKQKTIYRNVAANELQNNETLCEINESYDCPKTVVCIPRVCDLFP